MIDLVVTFILLGVIVLLLADRYFIVEQHQKKEEKLLDELSKATKAVISKNANEYVMTASIDKVAPEEKTVVEPDEIPEEALSNEDFFEAIGQTLKASKAKN